MDAGDSFFLRYFQAVFIDTLHSQRKESVPFPPVSFLPRNSLLELF
jgi:hypothetical protein